MQKLIFLGLVMIWIFPSQVNAQEVEVLVAPPFSTAFTVGSAEVIGENVEINDVVSERPLTDEEEEEFGIFGCNSSKWICGDVTTVIRPNDDFAIVYCRASNRKCAKIASSGASN